MDVMAMGRMITRMAGDASVSHPRQRVEEDVAVTVDVRVMITGTRRMAMPEAVVVRVELWPTNRGPGFGARRCGLR